MKFNTLVCGFALLFTSVLGLAVTGVPGTTQIRREIRDLARNSPQQYTLYLLALSQFQAQQQSSQTSYYQIAGIHGVPLVSWDGVGQCGNCKGAQGYCTHDSILFLGWHRAYLALFEQQLVSIAKSIANTYPSSTRASYVAAANKLRLPYWDWAVRPASGNNLPTLVTQPSVTVTGPNGQKKIANPLYSHHFTSTSALVYSPFKSWPNTLRYPTSNAASANSNEGNIITAFNNIRASLQDQLYQLFSTCDTFMEVGLDTASSGSNKCSNSLEALHNTVHTAAGGPPSKSVSGGHMTYLSEAAFDPLFWLHHTNVDRLFAMWQGVYPNSYGGSQVAPHTTWTIAKGSTQGPNSPLTPFHNSGGGFWTTNGVRNWRNLHYNYPEFANSNGSPAAIRGYINRLYGPNASATSAKKRDVISDTITPLIANNGSLFQYVANIETSRYALNGSYNIYLFNGNPSSEDPASWILDPNLIGPMGVLATEAMSASTVVAAGSIPLTRTLSDAVGGGLLSDLTEAAAVPFLMKNLQWRIAGPDGQEVDPASVPDFDITVFASTASPVSDTELPVWSEFIPLQDVTKGGDAPESSSSSAAPSSTTTSASESGTTATSTITSTSSGTTTATITNLATAAAARRLRVMRS